MNSMPSQEHLAALTDRIKQSLHPSLLRAPYDAQWTPGNPTAGFCSVAAEAAWFILGGKEAGWVAHAARDTDGSTHWWLMHESGERYDPTAEQYHLVGETTPYERGIKSIPCGFMGVRRDEQSPWGTGRKPSLRAQALLEKMDAIPKPKTGNSMRPRR